MRASSTSSELEITPFPLSQMMNNSQMGNMFDLESQSFSVFDPTASPTQDNGNNIVGSNGGASDQATVNNGGK